MMNNDTEAQQLLAFLDARHDELIEFVCDLVATPSINPPGDERAVAGVVLDKLRALDMPVKDEPDIVIQNIVATTNLESTLNLIQIAMSLGFENVEYEPEAFPGLVYRMDDPKVVLLLFGSGKMVCVGAREVNDIKNAVRNIKHELRTAGLLREG